jgi:superfamily II DNA or RNA helicase
MSNLQWQETDKNQFAVFIRDLSKNLNNVKHMIEDTMKQAPAVKHKNHKGKKHKPVKKKKDIIIEQQTKIRLEKQTKEDLSKLDYILETIDNEDPYKSFSLMKTSEGLHQLKFRLLHHFWSNRKHYFHHVMNLYFQLVGKGITSEDKRILSIICDKLSDTEYKLYMMKNLSHLLPPLNIHEPRVKQLDDWQIEVVNYIKRGESVIVKAPTSSGKSFVGLSAGILHKKILYVCPAKPIAYQVGAHFSVMGYKVHYLLDNLCHQGYDSKTTIFVGVPQTIEDNLYKLGVSFDYAVFDEIHNLNKQDDGNIYENIIKLVRCPFLALSATIGNIEYLLELFTKIHSDDLSNLREKKRKQATISSGNSYSLNTKVHYVEYKKRFINQQKMIYENGSLDTLHPLACIQIDDLNEDFLHQNLQFTPHDSAILWETIEAVFDKEEYDEDFEDMIDDCSPDNYFGDEHAILTLDDTRDYEQFIKQKLVELAKTHPKEITEILSEFRRVSSILNQANVTKDIIGLFKECKQKDCLPMLVFNTDTERCKQLFTNLFIEIDKSELEHYPYHYDILEYKEELYTKYKEKREQFIESIKIGKTNDAQTEKQTKVERYDKTAERKYQHDVVSYYHTCIHNIERSDVDDSLKILQIKLLKRELKQYQKYPSFCGIDIFQKHKDFCFSNSDPMSGDQIRGIRREIKKTLGIKIPYEHELFQMLKRGIGIYTEDMPEEYKWILQKLMDEKKIGIVISDRTLCLGIDLPIRSSCLLGLPGSKGFTIDDYLQMSGRAGRRGKDDRGNTIFYNLDYQQLMKGVLPTIVGSDKELPGNYKSFHLSVDEVYKNPINPIKDYPGDTYVSYVETKLPKLQWLLRYQTNVPDVIKEIDRWNKAIYNSVTDTDKELCVLNQIIRLDENRMDESVIDDYKRCLIRRDCSKFKDICVFLETIHNQLKDKKYTHMNDVLTRVHTKCKDMILKYQGLL